MRPVSNPSHEDRDAGQMLLATGVVLLMSLLSMAIFGVKVAGLTMPSRHCLRWSIGHQN